MDEINRILYKYVINTPDRAAHFLAQCTAESKLGNGPVEHLMVVIFLHILQTGIMMLIWVIVIIRMEP